MNLQHYLGERARFAAAALNENLGEMGLLPDREIRKGIEGSWWVPTAPTDWDSAMGGRLVLLWSDETLIASAIDLLGGEAQLDAFIADARARELA